MRRDRRRFVGWTVSGRRLAGGLLAGVAAVGLAHLPRAYDAARRLWGGVRPGVTVDGFPMGGLFPDEVRRRLDQLAARYRVPAQNARRDEATGRLVREVVGRELDRERTFKRILAARPFETVRPAFITILPSISTRHFRPIYRGPSDRPWVALSFNVDWGEEHLPALLDVLREHGVSVTFFLTGRWARKFPEAARRLADAGHEIGNHGMDHVHPTRLGDDGLQRLIRDAEVLLEDLTGQRPRLFAPPYGEVDDRVAAQAAQLGYYTIMWTVDTLDWKRPEPSAIVQRVMDGAVNGAIVLMHPTEPTVAALPAILRELRSRGFTIVPVGKMAAALQEPPAAEVAPLPGRTGP